MIPGAHNRDREKKEERRSVNRPHVNEIFGLRSHVSEYTICRGKWKSWTRTADADHGHGNLEMIVTLKTAWQVQRGVIITNNSERSEVPPVL